MSRLWGQLHQMELPTWLRAPALRLYIWMFQVRLTGLRVCAHACTCEGWCVRCVYQAESGWYPLCVCVLVCACRSGVRIWSQRALFLQEPRKHAEVSFVWMFTEKGLGPTRPLLNPRLLCVCVCRGGSTMCSGTPDPLGVKQFEHVRHKTRRGNSEGARALWACPGSVPALCVRV